jgi:hypothetical protein
MKNEECGQNCYGLCGFMTRRGGENDKTDFQQLFALAAARKTLAPTIQCLARPHLFPPPMGAREAGMVGFFGH